MNRLEPLYKITVQIEELLNQTISPKDRESVIGEVNNLIEARGHILDGMKPPFNEAEKQTGEELVAMNTVIQQKMSHLFTDLKQEMKQIKKQKKSNSNYLNPYKNVQINDGMFLDSKK